MKRPFACIGYTCLFTLAAAVFLLREWAFVWAGVTGILTVAAFLFPATREARVFPVALLTATLSLLWFGCWLPGCEQDAQLAGFDYQIAGRITEAPEKSGEKFVYILQVESAQGPDGKDAAFSGKLRVTTTNALPAEQGDSVIGKVYAYLPGENMRPYYAARGIYLSAFLYEYDDVEIKRAEGMDWKGWFLSFRERLEDGLYTLLPEEEAGLTAGIVLGDEAGISEELTDHFRMAGVSHLLSVSGLHLTILSQFLMGFLALLRLPKKAIYLLLLPIVLGFMALTGFSYSILRSGIMYLLYLIAELIGRKSEGLNSLGIAVLVICILNPFSAGDIGLLLSFSSTLGILLFSKPITDGVTSHFPVRWEVSLWRKPVLWVVDSVAVTLSSSILTIPVSIFSFGTISLLSPLANLLMVFPGSLLLVFGALTVLVGCLSLGAALPLGLVTGLLARYEETISRLFSSIPFVVVDASEPYLYFWVACVLILIGISLMMSRRRQLLPLVALLSLLLLVVGTVTNFFLRKDTVTVFGFYSDGEYHAAAKQNGRGVLLWGECPDTYTLAQYGISLLELDDSTLEGASFWDGKLHVEEKTEDFCIFSVYGNSMLICGEESDLSSLEQEWECPEFLWLEGIPKDWKRLSPEFTVALTRESRTAPYSQVIYTEDEIRLLCGPDGVVQAGRK